MPQIRLGCCEEVIPTIQCESLGAIPETTLTLTMRYNTDSSCPFLGPLAGILTRPLYYIGGAKWDTGEWQQAGMYDSCATCLDNNRMAVRLQCCPGRWQVTTVCLNAASSAPGDSQALLDTLGCNFGNRTTMTGTFAPLHLTGGGTFLHTWEVEVTL